MPEEIMIQGRGLLQNQPIHYNRSNSSRDGKYDLDHSSYEHLCFLYSLSGFSFVPSLRDLDSRINRPSDRSLHIVRQRSHQKSPAASLSIPRHSSMVILPASRLWLCKKSFARVFPLERHSSSHTSRSCSKLIFWNALIILVSSSHLERCASRYG